MLAFCNQRGWEGSHARQAGRQAGGVAGEPGGTWRYTGSALRCLELPGT